jgi:hypothetical protein
LIAFRNNRGHSKDLDQPVAEQAVAKARLLGIVLAQNDNQRPIRELLASRFAPKRQKVDLPAFVTVGGLGLHYRD